MVKPGSYGDPNVGTPRYHGPNAELRWPPHRSPPVDWNKVPRGTIQNIIDAHHPQFRGALQGIAATTRSLDDKSMLERRPMNYVDYMRYMVSGFSRDLTMEPREKLPGRAYEDAQRKGKTGDDLKKEQDTNHGPLVEFQMSGMRDAYCVGTIFNALALSYPEIAHAAQAESVYRGIGTGNADSVRAELDDYQKPVDMAALHATGQKLGLLSPQMGFDDVKVGSIMGFSRGEAEMQRRAGSHAVMVTEKGIDKTIGPDGKQRGPYIEVASGNNQFGATPGEDVGGGGFIAYRIYKNDLKNGVIEEPFKQKDGTSRTVGWHMDPDKMQAYHAQYMAERGLNPNDRARPMNQTEVVAAVARSEQRLPALPTATADAAAALPPVLAGQQGTVNQR